MLQAPVLLMAFNRPKTTAQVVERIVQARPRELFASVDGPRSSNPEDIPKCAAVRKIVESVPSAIHVSTLFQSQNLGCKNGVTGALDWFFQNNEYGIILEDDTLPDATFFDFAQSALIRYKDEERVALISGYNPLGSCPSAHDALFSRYGFIWGWASWKRVWMDYQRDLSAYCSPNVSTQIVQWLRSRHAIFFWNKAFEDIQNGLDTWDYQLQYSMFIKQRLALVSSRNLVANIGFGTDAVHTGNPHDSRKDLQVYKAPQQPVFPQTLLSNPFFDRQVVRRLFFNHDFTLLGRVKSVIRTAKKTLKRAIGRGA